MTLLNHTCIGIKNKAINMLYCFFEDIEQREQEIKTLLLGNKANFEKFFEMLSNGMNEDLTEKKNYILYELARLENMC